MTRSDCIASLAAVLALLAAASALAAEVVLVGLFPNKALVQIDGGAPRILATGRPGVDGVSLLSVNRDSATLLIDGRSRVLRMGQGNHGATGSAATTVTLGADARGHFSTNGQINGATVRFVVDTGATLVSLSQPEADRIGLDYSRGERVTLNTANGTVSARKLVLQSVRVGAIALDRVEAVVVENLTMPTLLGMSFLNRMDMRREGQIMTLTKRF